jgi:hypothetical protein
LLAGNGLATIILLLIDEFLHMNKCSSIRPVLLTHFLIAATLIFIGIIALLVVLSHPTSRRIFERSRVVANEDEDSLSASVNLSTPDALDNVDSIDQQLHIDSPNENPQKLSLFDIFKKIWRCAMSALIINITLVGVAGVVQLIKSSSNNDNLPEIIQYVSAIATFVGNQLCVMVKPTPSQKALFWIVVVRFFVFPYLVVYITTDFFHNDIFITTLLGVFAVSGGYLNSLSYKLSTVGISEVYHSKVSLLVNICLYLGVYGGIGTAFVLPIIVGGKQSDTSPCPPAFLWFLSSFFQDLSSST